ncbi:protein FAM81A-like [Ptychodera flava]|uniref:protein FAM81A-like n=1 Tax=Ptychodera flava TaxID=63121 RepID=UPI00396A76F9
MTAMAGVSPRFPSLDAYDRPPSRRLDVIEDRLLHQEKTTQSLLDRAFKIKEDIIDSMNLTHGTWQGEKQARDLLQEHIRTITLVVKRLSREIEILEDRIQASGNVGGNTQSVVKNLELHHVGSVVDLRGRVARCDASIARLSADLRTVYESIAVLNRQLQDNNTIVLNAVRKLDSKMGQLTDRIDRTSVDNTLKIKTVEGESSNAVAKLDSKTKGYMEDLKSTIAATKTHNDTEREKLARQFVHQLEMLQTVRDAKQDQFEDRVMERIRRLEKRMDLMEDLLKKDRESYKKAETELRHYWEGKFEARQAYLDNKIHEEMEKMRLENRRGFANVHDSISSTKDILDNKRKLMSEHFTKEIRDIKKMVVLI